MKKIFILLVLLLSVTTQSQTVAITQNLINTNLATGTKITAEKHRAVENSLLTLVQKSLPLARGSFHIGDIGTDAWFTISFPSVGTSSYYVVGSIRSLSSDYSKDNDHTWIWRDVTPTSFVMGLRDIGGNVSNIDFYWEIKSL